MDGFSGFRFAQFALFATTENPANANTDKRPPAENARAGRIPQILILTNTRARRRPLDSRFRRNDGGTWEWRGRGWGMTRQSVGMTRTEGGETTSSN